jgi:hypothetical protein
MKSLLFSLALAAFAWPAAAQQGSANGVPSLRAPLHVAQRGLGRPPAAESEAREHEGEGFSAAQLRQLERMLARLLSAARREPPRRPEPPRPAEHHDREVHYHYHYYHRDEHKEEHHSEHHEHRSVHYHYHYHYN